MSWSSGPSGPAQALINTADGCRGWWSRNSGHNCPLVTVEAAGQMTGCTPVLGYGHPCAAITLAAVAQH